MQDNKNKPEIKISDIFAVVIIAVVAYFIISYFKIHLWFHAKTYSFAILSVLPEWIRGFSFYYSDVIPLIYEDLKHNAPNYAVYYTQDPVGIRKYQQINQVSVISWAPVIALFVSMLAYLELRKKKHAIRKPRIPGAMYAYARSQMEIWPFIKRVAPIMEKIIRSPIDSGDFAIAKLPISWVGEKDLLLQSTGKKKRDLFTVKERRKFTLDRGRCYQAFVEQLGDKWTTPSDLSFDEKCVFSVLVPHIYGRVAESRLMNRQINSYHNPSLSKREKKELGASLKKEVDSIVKRYKPSFEMPFFDRGEFDDPYDPIASSFAKLDSEQAMFDKGDELIKQILLKHRYVKTVFLALIEKSWTYGVLSSAELNWVKGVDRGLFYVLSQQGRYSAFVEVGGPWSHFLAESTYGFKMLSPQVFEAVRAIDYELFRTHSNYIPHEEWEDNSRWDKLVPDSVSGQAGLPSSSGSSGQVPL